MQVTTHVVVEHRDGQQVVHSAGSRAAASGVRRALRCFGIESEIIRVVIDGLETKTPSVKRYRRRGQ